MAGASAQGPALKTGAPARPVSLRRRKSVVAAHAHGRSGGRHSKAVGRRAAGRPRGGAMPDEAPGGGVWMPWATLLRLQLAAEDMRGCQPFRVLEAPGFLSPAECAAVIALAQARVLRRPGTLVN